MAKKTKKSVRKKAATATAAKPKTTRKPRKAATAPEA